MSERTAELSTLAQRLTEHEAIADAWLAKSFTDQLLVVDVVGDREVPGELRTLLAAHDLYGAHEVYGSEDAGPSSMGAVGDTTRHQFVDVRTRGEHQSYVPD